MMGLTNRGSRRERGLYLGIVPEAAAARNGSTPLTLDHDLDVLPEAGRHMTVAELAAHVNDLAGRMSAAGIRPGERAVIHKSANFDVWVLATAAARIGAVPVMLSHTLDAATVGALLRRLDRPHLLTDGHKLDTLSGVDVAGLTSGLVSVAGNRPGAVSLAELAGTPQAEPVFQGLDEPVLITHTSGTTGLPKLVVHTPRSFHARLRPQLFLLSLMRKKETISIHVPFVHSRIIGAMSVALQKAMPVLLVNGADPDDIVKLFTTHQPGLIEALPNSFVEWEGLAGDPRKPFASVKYFSSTFDAIHPRTIDRLLSSSQRRAPMFFQLYGQSEVGPAVGRAYFRKSAYRTDVRCVGFPVPGGPRVRVVSRDGNRPSKKNAGFIEVRGDNLAKSYFGERERFDANLHDGWWRTGDVGYRTWRGCLHMLDREIDVIPGVSSNLEIEDLMMSRLDELSEVVVVPGPGSEPVPVICTDQDQPLDLDRWRAAAAEFPQLTDPVQIHRAELPVTATLKVRRIELASLLRQRMAQR